MQNQIGFCKTKFRGFKKKTFKPNIESLHQLKHDLIFRKEKVAIKNFFKILDHLDDEGADSDCCDPNSSDISVFEESFRKISNRKKWKTLKKANVLRVTSLLQQCSIEKRYYNNTNVEIQNNLK